MGWWSTAFSVMSLRIGMLCGVLPGLIWEVWEVFLAKLNNLQQVSLGVLINRGLTEAKCQADTVVSSPFWY